MPLTYDRVNPVQRGNIYLGEKDHVEGFFMYFRPEQILEQYEIEIRSVSKGRDCYLCETNLGGKALKEYRGSRERAEFLAGMLEFLSRQKLLVETVIRTKEGEPLASEEEEQQKYILVDAFRGLMDELRREPRRYRARRSSARWGWHRGKRLYPGAYATKP